MTFIKFSYHTVSCLYIPFFLKNKIITLEQRTALYMTTIHSPSPPVRPCVQGFVECSFVSRMYPLPPMALHLLKQLVPQVQCRCCCRSLVTKSCVTFATPWTAACQASLSFTISQSLPKLKSIESWYHPTMSSSVALFSSCHQSFLASGSFPLVSSLHHVVKLLQLQL